MRAAYTLSSQQNARLTLTGRSWGCGTGKHPLSSCCLPIMLPLDQGIHEGADKQMTSHLSDTCLFDTKRVELRHVRGDFL